MSVGNATLGCDPIYEFRITTSCDNTPIQTLRNVLSYKFNRIVDKISNGRVTFAALDTPECRLQIGQIILGRHYLTIIRNGCVEWKGPIKRMEYAEGRINLFASDPLWWTTRRVAPPFYATPDGAEQSLTNVVFATPKDLFVTRILDLLTSDTDNWATANNLPGTDYDSGLTDCDEGFNPVCFRDVIAAIGALPDGPIEIVSTTNNKFTTLYKVLQELAKTLIDYTVIGEDLLFGYPTVPIPDSRRQNIPVLSNTSWKRAPRVVKDIDYLANEVFVNTKLAQDSLLDSVVYENGGVRVQDCDFLKHGWHQVVIDRTSASSTEEALAAGQSYIRHNNQNNSISYIENTKKHTIIV